jgi:hypothetical protein
MALRFGKWTINGLYRTCSLKTVPKEMSKYVSDLAGVQIRWDRSGTELADTYTFFCGMGNENLELGAGCFVHMRIISAVRSVQLVSNSMPYIVL